MTRTDEEKVKASILEALENWWDGAAQALDVQLPYIGDDVHAQMANAALAVLLAAGSTYETLQRNGELVGEG